MASVRELWRALNTPVPGLSFERGPDAVAVRQARQMLSRQGRVLRELAKERRKLQQQLDRSVRRQDVPSIAACGAMLAETVRQEALFKQLCPSVTDSSREAESVFVFPTLLLKESFEHCTERPEEGMHLVAGIELEGLAVATEILPFPYEHRSMAAARGNHLATHRLAIEMHEAGYRILALMHSHPGTGEHANQHSGEDANTQRLWERTTRMVSGIWSRDGYLRFFSWKLPFSVRLAGNHVEQVNERLFRLQVDSSVEEHETEALAV